jgi:RND superfamily putative drug exporter
MHLLGPAAWWFPRWLSRLLPNVDIEGAALERRHHVQVEEPEPAHVR